MANKINKNYIKELIESYHKGLEIDLKFKNCNGEIMDSDWYADTIFGYLTEKSYNDKTICELAKQLYISYPIDDDLENISEFEI